MVPGMMGVAAFQLNVLVTGAATFFVDKRIFASFDYAVRLMELPQGLFGVSLATYLLPTLSGLAVDKKFPEFRTTLRQGISYLVFIIRLLFEHHKFTADSTDRTSYALMMLAPGLVAFSVVNILARAFYALGDTTTPMKISAFALACNLVFGLTLVWNLKQAGLGLANTASATLNAGLLAFALRKKLKTLDFGPFRKDLPALATCAALAALLSLVVSFGWERGVGHSGFLRRLGAVAAPVAAACLAYFPVALWLKIEAARDIFALFKRRLHHPKT
jgi:putative peptidoglycan lipid II flippase